MLATTMRYQLRTRLFTALAYSGFRKGHRTFVESAINHDTVVVK